MKEIKLFFQSLILSFGGIIGGYFGELDGFFYTLVAFVVVDYITGVLRAIVERKLSSSIGFKGIAKKMMIFIMVGIGHLIDSFLIIDGGSVLRTAVIFFYVANEGISIIENSVTIGLPVPAKLKAVLEQLKEGDHHVK